MKQFIIPWISRVILKLIDNDTKVLFRKVENIKKKSTVTEMHQKFNEICLKENLRPIYTDYY